MYELLRSVRLLFARELDRIEAAATSLRRWVLPRGARPIPHSQAPRLDRRAWRGFASRRLADPGRPARARREGRRARAAPSRREARARRLRVRSLGVSLGSATLSILAHAVVLAVLFSFASAPPSLPPAPETVIQIFLPIAPRPEPAPPAPSLEEVTEPEASSDTAGESEQAQDALARTSPGADLEGRSTDPTAGRDPHRDTVEVARSPPPPLPIGLGPATAHAQSGERGTLEGFPSRGQGKAEALRRFGGSRETERAVALGLAWLAAHQDSDGGWSAEGYIRHCRGSVPCRGLGLPEFDVGVTALATLAFLGAGYVPEGLGSARGAAAALGLGRKETAAPSYGPALRAALERLLLSQDTGGFFGRSGDHYMYNHALATFALSEAFAVTSAEMYQKSVLSALDASAAAQQVGGGWDYTAKPTGRNDLSVSGWQIMALRSALQAGLPVQEGMALRARRYLQTAVTPTGEGIYADLGQERGRRGINMVAVGLLSKLYLGAGRTETPVRGAASRLLRVPPDASAMAAWETTFQSYYYWYTATLALFHLGGEEWRAWNVFLLRELLPLQSQRPHEAGSWPPEMSWIGVSGGRVYATAINVLTLETYYRYEPFYANGRS